MNVLRLQDTGTDDLSTLFSAHGLHLEMVDGGLAIPGSHWGDEEAGLITNTLYARPDTPVHSTMHEACHWLLMSDERRAVLHTNAHGTVMEESAVCYLQIVLADQLNGVGRVRMMQDMDAWGYSFRLGSSQAWFEHDAHDALAYLRSHPIAASISALQA